MHKILLSTLFFIASLSGIAQSGKIFGKVTDQLTGNPLAFAPVAIQGAGFGALSNDSLRNYQFKAWPLQRGMQLSGLPKIHSI